MKLSHLYAWLFRVNFFISAFTFGGGYVVIPMIRKYFVEQKQMFEEEELTDMAAIAQSAPGAIAINLSVLAGYRTAGQMGALISSVAAVLPPILILSVVSVGYHTFRDSHLISVILKGMEAGVAALIVDLVIDLYRAVLGERRLLLTLIAPAAFGASFFLGVNVALILVVCCVVCLAAVWLQKRRGHDGNLH